MKRGNDGAREKGGARAALGGQGKPRALWKEGWGSRLFSVDVKWVTSDAE